MPNPDPDVLKMVAQWLKFADEDFNMSSDALSYGHSRPYRLIAYHYPGEDMEVTETEATNAMETARKVRKQVRMDLKLLGMELTE